MIELADLKKWVGATHEADDDLLADLERRAIAHLESETRRYFGPPAPVTEVLDGPGRDAALWLSDTPLSDPALQLDVWDGTAWQVVAADDYTVDVAGSLYHSDAWQRGRRLYRATYHRGYAPGQEPADIRGAVLQLVHLWYVNRPDAVVGTVVAKMPHGVDRVIQAHRRYRV